MAIHKLSWNWCLKITEEGLHSDGGNLYLQVGNGGAAKSWIFRYTDRRTKIQVPMGLGSIYDRNIDEAREKARVHRQQLRDGKDPLTERDGDQLDANIAAKRAKTVRQVWDEFSRAKLAHLKPTSRYQANRLVRNFILAKIGDMPIAKVDQGVANTVLSAEFWNTMNPTAVQVHSYAKRIFSFAMYRGYYTAKKNPFDWVDNLKHVLTPSKLVHKKKHRASLPYKDLPRFMVAVRSYQDRSFRDYGHPNVALWLEMVVLTGVRISEPRLARWKEFDFTTMVWTVPPEQHKDGGRSGEPHLVPITPQMLAILEEMQRRRLDPSPDAYVFPSPYRLYKAYGRKGMIGRSFEQHPTQRAAREHPGYGTSRPFARGALQKFIVDSLKWEIKIDAHGFRSTLRDWCRANKYPSEWWDLQVAHVLGNEVSQSYGHDPLVEERRGMMKAYCEYALIPPSEPIAADNVFSLADRRAAS
jgi:integrase